MLLSFGFSQVWDIRTTDCVHQLSSMGLVEPGHPKGLQVERTEHVPSSERVIDSAAVDASQHCLFTTCGDVVRVWDLEKLENIGKIGDSSSPLG